MAFRSEFAEWRDELEPPVRLSIAERLAKWFERSPPVQPCPYRWVRMSEVIPIEGEDE